MQPAMPRDIYVNVCPLAIPAAVDMPKKNTHNIRNTYFLLLSFHVIFLNFNENIGISHTSNQLNMITNANKNGALNIGEVRYASLLEIRAAQKIAFAGVGIPMKVVCCRSSILNLASRMAENAAMMNAVNGMTVNQKEL